MSRGEWAEGRFETAARAIVTRAIAAKRKKRSWKHFGGKNFESVGATEIEVLTENTKIFMVETA